MVIFGNIGSIVCSYFAGLGSAKAVSMVGEAAAEL